MEIRARHWAGSLTAALCLHGLLLFWLGTGGVFSGSTGGGPDLGAGLSLELSLSAGNPGALRDTFTAPDAANALTPLIEPVVKAARAPRIEPVVKAARDPRIEPVVKAARAPRIEPVVKAAAIATPTEIAESEAARPVNAEPARATEAAAEIGVTGPAADSEAAHTVSSQAAHTRRATAGDHGTHGGPTRTDAQGSGRGDAGLADGEGWPAYLQALSETVESNLRYARRAQRRGIEGRVIVGIVLTANGDLSRARVRESSGRPLLDDDALRTAQRAAPYPPPPPGLVAREIEIPVDYGLVVR